MSQLLNEAFDPESFRKNGHQLIDILSNYLTDVVSSTELKPLPWQAPDDLAAYWRNDLSTTETQSTEEAMTEFCHNLIARSIHLHHPRNMGHQVAAPVPMAALMDLVSALLNNSMAVYEVGPSSSAIEKILMEWLGSILGMPETCDGILTNGGSSGNLTGLLAARQHKTKYDVWEMGGEKPLAVMVSSESHYSIERAVKIMGWGKEGIVKIPVNQRMEIDANQLEQTYQHAIQQGKEVIAVVANACSTSTGTYDPLELIADFCLEKDLWFHVDAAHGGGAVMSSKYKHLVKGIERADSLVIDFHKMLLCPSLATAVMFKNGDDSFETFSQKAEYLLEKDKRGNWWDIAQRTLECTKKMLSIKIYALLKIYGRQLFDDYVTQAYDLGNTFAVLIDEADDFELALQPASNIVCFRYAPAEVNRGNLDKLNSGIREQLKEEGEFYIVQTVISGNIYLRTTLMSPFTRSNDLAQLLEKIRN